MQIGANNTPSFKGTLSLNINGIAKTFKTADSHDAAITKVAHSLEPNVQRMVPISEHASKTFLDTIKNVIEEITGKDINILSKPLNGAKYFENSPGDRVVWANAGAESGSIKLSLDA